MLIRDVFAQHSKRINFDQSFAREVKSFYNGFINKNSEHSNFFGSGLLGVHRLRWSPQETGTWFSEIVKADPDELENSINELPSVDPTHNVASDPLNLSVVWLVHKTLNSKSLSKTQAKETAIHLVSILHFKYISSILARYFEYGSDPQIALRCFEAMNYKFDLRVYKTWGRLIQARATQIVSASGIHLKCFMKMDDDEDVQYIVTDIQTRIRVVIRKLTALYYEVKAENSRVVSISNLIEVDGEMEVRDVKRSLTQYRRYLTEIISDQPTFIRSELITTVERMNPSMSVASFILTLEYISNQYNEPKQKKLRDYVDYVLEFSFDLIKSKGINPKNLIDVASGVKGVVNSSRNKEKSVAYLRKEGEKIVRDATGKKPQVPVFGERTGIILYILLRAMTMNYFKTR